TPTTQATSGCLSALKAEGRNRKLANATSAPIANVIAASWNAGIFPVATVNTDRSDHIRIAVSPISVAARGVMGKVSFVMAGHRRLPCADYVNLSALPAIHLLFRRMVLKTWMPGTSSAKTRFALLPGHDDFSLAV